MYVIFYILSIPFRLLKLTAFFIQSKEDFRTSLEFLTLDAYDLIRDLNIEVLKNKIYLNCNNLIKLGKLLLSENPLLPQTLYVKGMIELQKKSIEFSIVEKSYGRAKMCMSIIYDENNKEFCKIPHYTVIENDTTIHATSNVNFDLKKNQRVDGIIPTLVKNGAIQPGTVITKGVSKIKLIKQTSV
jgi:hypothetical protein